MKTAPQGCCDALEFPAWTRRLDPSRFARPVSNGWLTEKPGRAWQLPLWMPACLCHEEKGTSAQFATDTGKISSIARETDIPLAPWILDNIKSPALIAVVTKSCYSRSQSFLAARRPAKSCLHPPQPTFFLETTTVWHLEPTDEHRRSFWKLAFSSAKPIDQIFKKYIGVIRVRV